MKVVLYGYDLVPITIIDLPYSAMKVLRTGSSYRISTGPLPGGPAGVNGPMNEVEKLVTIRAEPLLRKGVESLLLFVDDEETSMKLHSVFLPGQHKDVMNIADRSFCNGFLTALNALC